MTAKERLTHWFETAGGNQLKELRTAFLAVFIDAMAQEASGENPDATVGLGDAAISWILKNLPRLKSVDGESLSVGPDEIALVLTEDGPYGDGRSLPTGVKMRRQSPATGRMVPETALRVAPAATGIDTPFGPSRSL